VIYSLGDLTIEFVPRLVIVGRRTKWLSIRSFDEAQALRLALDTAFPAPSSSLALPVTTANQWPYTFDHSCREGEGALGPSCPDAPVPTSPGHADTGRT
jgi:hypothetical protein